jgi:hypothetical protein
MNSKANKRIALFEYDWPLYSIIKDFSVRFAEQGYNVDIFYKGLDTRFQFIDKNEFDQYSKIHFYNFSHPNSFISSFLQKFSRLFQRFYNTYLGTTRTKDNQIISNKVFSKSVEIISKSQYLCFIGIEKKGLIWAGRLSKIFKCPFLYHSLELYIEDHPEIHRYIHLREAEKKYHKLASATIIQDKQRASALYQSNNVFTNKTFLFPVSVKGKKVESKSNYLHEKYAINKNKKILLYFGGIYKSRSITKLVRMANLFDDNVVSVIHGSGPSIYINYLRALVNNNKVIFSLTNVDEREITELISSADIGIALYETTNSNDRLIAHSSVKIAYYTQCGIPIIAFNTECLSKLMESYKFGELINSIDEIPQKVSQILGNLGEYRQNSYKAFDRYYSFDTNFSKFFLQFEQTIRKEEIQ